MLWKHNASAWTVLYLCSSSLFQKHILVWFSNAFLSSGTLLCFVYSALSITKEINPHTSTVKNLTVLSLQDQVHVVTATECTGQRRWTGLWDENSFCLKCKCLVMRMSVQRYEICKCPICSWSYKCNILMVCLRQLWKQDFLKKVDLKTLGKVETNTKKDAYVFLLEGPGISLY